MHTEEWRKKPIKICFFSLADLKCKNKEEKNEMDSIRTKFVSYARYPSHKDVHAVTKEQLTN